nr:hypothetical protein [Tanacetum cinerariifolium]
DDVKDDDNDDDKSEGDEDRGMDSDDVQDKKADFKMTDALHEKEKLEITQEQVVEDAHVTITKKTEVLVTSSSRSSDLASKFLNSSDIPLVDAEISLHWMFMFIMKYQESTHPLSLLYRSRVIALEKDVAELKNDPIHTQVTTLVDDHLDTRIGATREEFINFLSASMTDRINEQVMYQLPQILLEEVSNFAPPVIRKMIQESLNQVNLEKASSQPQSTYEAATTLTEFELKKILIDKINSSKSYLTAPEHRECYDGLVKSYNLDKDFSSSYDVYSLKHIQDDKDKDEGPSAGSNRGLKKRKTSKDAEPTTSPKNKDSSSRSSKGTKSQPKSCGKSVHAEEPEFEVGDINTPQGQEGNQGNDNDEPRTESAYRRGWFTQPSRPQEPTDPDWNEDKTPQKDFSSYILNGLKIKNPTQEILLGPTFRLLKGTRLNYAELEYDFEECYKALSEKLNWETLEGGIEDMVLNIWSPVKVAYDKYALWGISHWRDQRKTLYAYAKGIQSRGDVYSTKRILTVTHASVMMKHGYGYLEEIVVKRADNKLYKFKEGDFPRLWINDIEDMLLLVVQNRLTNLSGDDVSDFAIALRMFTRSLVIQKRVEDLQLRVENYQKQINVTKPDTTRPNRRKRHPYTPLKNPQGFIYIDDYQRNKLMSGELYKFNDDMLTRLLSSLEDITKNIDMEYLPKKKWSTLEKKRAHCMIKYINKLLKERRMMRSLEKFVGEPKERCNIKAFKLSYQEKYEHVGPEVTRSQDGRLQDDVKRLCLVDDLKKLKDHIHIKTKELALSKVKDIYIKSQVDD